MADSLALATTSLLFFGRNSYKFNKAISNENNGTGILRFAPAAGQIRNALNHISKIDNSVGKGAKSAIEAFGTAAKNSKFLEYTGQAVNLAGKYVNPLICVSAGVDVLRSDDKQSALIQNTAALSSMFAVEHLMKKHLDDVVKIKGIDKIAEKFTEFASKYKHGDKFSSIIRGVAFVVGSCTAYSIGQKFGTLAAQKVKTSEQQN